MAVTDSINKYLVRHSGMKSLEKQTRLLLDFGLTPNEAKVYVAIISLGSAQVSTISKFVEVRRETVYRALPKLGKMGLIEKSLTLPYEIRASPVESALSSLFDEVKQHKEEEIESLEIRLADFLAATRDNTRHKTEVEKPSFFSIRGKSVMTRVGAMFKKARQEISIYASLSELGQLVFFCGKELSKKMGRGIRVRVITDVLEKGQTSKIVSEFERFSSFSFQLKAADSIKSSYIIVDGKEMMLSISENLPFFERSFIWINDKNLIGLFRDSFRNQWNTLVSTTELKLEHPKSEKILPAVELKSNVKLVIDERDRFEESSFVLDYIKEGLSNNQSVVLFVSDEEAEWIKEGIKQLPVYGEVKKPLGFHCETISDSSEQLVKRLYNEALENGFAGLRSVTGLSCLFEQGLIDKLIEYEKMLIKGGIPIINILAYNTSKVFKSKDPYKVYAKLFQAIHEDKDFKVSIRSNSYVQYRFKEIWLLEEYDSLENR